MAPRNIKYLSQARIYILVNQVLARWAWQVSLDECQISLYDYFKD